MLEIICANLSGDELDRSQVAAIDEVGRGPAFGDVVSAAVIIPETFPVHLMGGIKDSKKLSERRLEERFAEIMVHAHVGIGSATPEEIDRINIRQATFLAMARAFDALAGKTGSLPALALVDGNDAPALPCEVRTIVAGDAVCLQIAAASIVAKVSRDRSIVELARTFPGYGLERNVGYLSPEHREAILRLGSTPLHRETFLKKLKAAAPVSK
jgi:ribonuclease HII